jgi:flotillin
MKSIWELIVGSDVLLLIVGVVGVGIALMSIRLILNLWQKVPPNKILVIYGMGGTRVVTGGGAFVFPVFQDTAELDRSVMKVEASGDSMPTKTNIMVVVDWIAQIQFGDTDQAIKTAAGAFLKMTHEQIVELIRGTVAGSVRAVIATLTPEEARGDRESFAAKVNEIVRDDLERMGLRITSLNIVEVDDEQGYYDNLAAGEEARVAKNARISKAEADREAREREAENKLAARQAEIGAEEAQAQRQRDLDLKRAAFSAETNAATAEADMAGAMRKAELERQLRVSEGASQLAAEAAATEVAEQATARRRNLLQAEVVAVAEAEAERIVALAGAEQAAAASRAEAVRQAAQAEADGIAARAKAEAEGQHALAEALGAFNAAGLQQQLALALIQVLPQLAQAQAQALAGINEVRILDSGNGSGMRGFAQQLPFNLMQVLELARVAGIDLPKVLSELTATPAQPVVAEGDETSKA